MQPCKPKTINLRIIAATPYHFNEEVAAWQFSMDLFPGRIGEPVFKYDGPSPV